MLFWQHKNVRKRHTLWAKLMLLSLVVHSSSLFWVFFVYRGNAKMLSLTISQSIIDVPVTFMTEYPVAKKSVTKIVQQNAQKISAKQAKSECTKEVRAKEEKKVELKNKVVSVQKTVKKLQQPIIKKEEQIKGVQKKLEITSDKKHIQQEEQKIIKQPMQNQNQTVQKLAVGSDVQKIVDELNDPKLVQLCIQLRNEITHNWKPPVGVSPDCQCQISVIVNWDGIIQDIQIHESSGVLIYDITARNALLKTNMPQWTRGKTFSITFKQ